MTTADYGDSKKDVTITDRLADAKAQGQAQFESIREMVADLEAAQVSLGNAMLNDATACEHVDEVRQTIHEDALSVLVRSDWYAPGEYCNPKVNMAPAEYEILLCTGGPACRIVGELSEHGEPETARLEVQDWFTPWTAYRPLVSPENYDSEPILLAYAREFYFGEG